MRRWSEKFALIFITLWVGGLWITGLWASVLFKFLADRHLAGQIAGQFFHVMSLIGMGVGAYLLLQRLFVFGGSTFKQGYFWAVLLMLLLVLAGYFGIQPILAQLKIDAQPNDVMNSVFASRFATWHGVASVAYLLECLLGLMAVLKMRG
jgi:hypothetical protein